MTREAADRWETSVCDLCGSSREVELYPASPAVETLSARAAFSSSREKAVHGRIVRCLDCRLVRTNPRDSGATLEHAYSQLVDPAYESERSNRRNSARRKLRFLHTRARPPGHLLDVGCSTGIFLSAARKAGWRVSGLEPSRWAAAKAREWLGADVVREVMLEAADLPHASFDAITMWDVLEHVQSPRRALELAATWLKPSGSVAINVPNIESLTARVMGRRWVLLLREHLWYFSPATLASLCASSDLELAAVRPNWVRFSLRNVLIRLGQHRPKGNNKVIERVAKLKLSERLSLRFPIGELLAIATRRP